MPGPSLEIKRHYGRLSPIEETDVVEELVGLIVGFLTMRASEVYSDSAAPGPEAIWMTASTRRAPQNLPIPTGGGPRESGV